MLKFLAVLREREIASVGGEVGAASGAHAVEGKGIARNMHDVRFKHADIALSLIALHQRHADDEHCYAEVCKVHAPRGTRHAGKTTEDAGAGGGKLQFAANFLNDAAHHEDSQRRAGKDPGAPGAHQKRNGNADRDRHHKAPGEALHERHGIGFLPACDRPHCHQEHQREHQRTEDRIKVRRPNRNLAGIERIEEERIERAQKDGAHRHHQQNIVDQQHGFARDQCEVAAQTHRWRTPSEKQERKPDHQNQESQNKEAAFRIRSKRMHRRENARTDEEGPQERE